MKALTPAVRRRRIEQVAVDATQILGRIEPAVQLLHDSQNGHPRAARYDTDSTRQPLWCFTHERDHALCERDALLCGGTPVTAHDPTGDAATSPDPAATDLARVDQAVTAAHNAITLLANVTATWQPTSTDMQRPIPGRAVTAPPGWCESCWLNDQEPVEIKRRDGGLGPPRYAGLCDWCGDFRATHGQLPVLAILKVHHARRNVTERLIRRHQPLRRTA